MASLIVSALSTWSNKGLKKAEKDVSAFDKTVKKVGKAFAAAFSAQAILNFSKASVKAFMADEKAAKALEVQLNNLGYSYSVPGVELYISNLQKMYGVMDDQLRPAFQTLITASGSLTQSQKALDVALNVSAATGKSVEEVSAALAKGFSGQTTALTRLGAGLDKTILATGDMNKIMEALQTKFSGQAAARLDTYAGKMDRLAVGAANAQEIIGKDLLDAISLLGKDQSIDDAADAMENLATNVGNVVVGMASLIAKAKELTGLGGGDGNGNLLMAIPVLGSYLTALSNYGASQKMEQNKSKSNFTYEIWDMAGIQARAKELELLKKRNKVTGSLLAKEKAKLALGDLEKKFDVERIGLMAALNAATDDETKLRLKSQLAILDQDAALAKKYNAELEATAALNALNIATRGLTLQMGASISDIQKYLAASMVNYNQSIATGIAPTVAPSAITASQVNAYLAAQAKEVTMDTQSYLEKLRTTVKSGYEIPSVESFYGGLSSMTGSLPSSNVNNKVEVTVNGSILALQDLDKAIEDAMLRIQRQNGSLTPAGSIQ
jgi:hypothetical protein